METTIVAVPVNGSSRILVHDPIQLRVMKRTGLEEYLKKSLHHHQIASITVTGYKKTEEHANDSTIIASFVVDNNDTYETLVSKIKEFQKDAKNMDVVKVDIPMGPAIIFIILGD